MTVYVPQSWTNGVAGGTPVNGARLSHMEAGIVAVDQRIDALPSGGGGGSGSGGTAMVYNATTGLYISQAWSPYVGPVDPTTVGGSVTNSTPWLDTDPSLFGLGVAALPVSGYWITTPHAARSTTLTTVGRVFFSPLWVSQRFTASGLGVEATTATANAQIQVGIYDSSGSLPGNLVQNGGVLDISTISVQTSPTFSQVLNPGLYWLSCIGLTAAATVRAISVGGTLGSIAAANPGGASVNGMWRLDSQSALPNVAPSASAMLATTGPVIWIQSA